MVEILLLILMAVLLIAAHRQGIKADSSNKVFGGVCAGLARYFNLTPSLMRVLTFLFTLVTGGFAILLYILLWITLPTE
jgi:phage shock protein C